MMIAIMGDEVTDPTSAEATKRMFMIGLSRENINRLVAGQPISVTPESHHAAVLPGWQLVIIFGETEMDMKRELEKIGAIGPETKTYVDPRLK